MAALAHGALGHSPGPRLSAVLTSVAGNPLDVREIIDTLRPNELRYAPDGTVDLDEDIGPPQPESISRRLSVLNPKDLQSLRVVALLGNEFTQRELAAILTLARDDTERLLDVASAAGVIASAADGRFVFRHELIRHVLEEQTPKRIRGVLHGHIARTLAGLGCADSTVAVHVAATPDPLDLWWRAWLVGLSESTLYGAPAKYADLLVRSVAGMDERDPRWEALASRLVLVSFWLGRDDSVIEFGRRLLGRTAKPDHAARLSIQVIRAFARLGRFAEALEVAVPVLADVRVGARWHARLRGWVATTKAHMGLMSEANVEAHHALACADELGDSIAIACAHNTLALLAEEEHQVVHIDAGLAMLGDDPESMELRLLLLCHRAARLVAWGKAAEAEVALSEVTALAEGSGTYGLSTVLGHAAQYCYEMGRWDDALLHIDRMDPTALRHPSFAYLHGLRALVMLRRDQREEADTHLAAAGISVTEPLVIRGPTGIHLAEAAAVRAEISGELVEALRIRSQYLDLPAGPQRDTRCQEAPHLMRLALALGEDDIARAASDAVADTKNGAVDSALAARTCRALLDRDATEVGSIADAYRTHGWSMHAAFALEEASALLAESGDVTSARSSLTKALEIYAGQAANWELRRAEARFRAYGIRRGVRGTHRKARTGWEALTATELRVSRLVAKGLSNPDIAKELILSRNTVQTHVSNVLSKLGLQSRVEVAREITIRESPTRLRAPRTSIE